MQPEPTDLYAILELTPHATRAELSRAYRTLLRQHHPDTRTVEHGQSSSAADAAELGARRVRPPSSRGHERGLGRRTAAR